MVLLNEEEKKLFDEEFNKEKEKVDTEKGTARIELIKKLAKDKARNSILDKGKAALGMIGNGLGRIQLSGSIDLEPEDGKKKRSGGKDANQFF